MRFALRNNARSSRHDRTTHDAPAGPDRRPGRLSRLATAGVALFALAAAPMSHAAGDGLPDAVASAVSTTVATVATTALEATTSDAPHGLTDPQERAVRTVVASPAPPAEQASFTPPPEPDEQPADEAAEEAGQQEDEEDASADGAAEADGAPDEDATTQRSVWDDLADCESGDWDANGQPRPGTARWDYGVGFTHEGYEQFQGGLNFHPGTWDAYRDPGMPDHAGHADRQQQIVVGERVLASQGWGAWPVCSEMIGLR